MIDDRVSARRDIAFGDMNIHQQPSHGLQIARRGLGQAGFSEPYGRQNRSRSFSYRTFSGMDEAINNAVPSNDRSFLSRFRVFGENPGFMQQGETSGVNGSRCVATRPTRWCAFGSTMGIIRISAGKPKDFATLRGMMLAQRPVRTCENNTIIEFDSSVGCAVTPASAKW